MSPVMTVCSGCGRIFRPTEMSRSRRGRCIACAKAYEREKSRLRRQKKGTTAQRGYGREHERLRKYWALRVNAGIVDCARCGVRIQRGELWDLGHDDEDRSRYSGPEHRGCNRATRSPAMAERVRRSREW
jgi:DNA-directed RNA polymerase subunit RPC12/RpoP